MDVFTLAAEILGDVRLTSGQLGQLRALEYRLLVESLRETAPPSRTQLVDEILEMLEGVRAQEITEQQLNFASSVLRDTEIQLCALVQSLN